MPTLVASGNDTRVVIVERLRTASIVASEKTVTGLTSEATPVRVSSPGPQGARGIPGSSGSGLIAPINFSYGDSSPANILVFSETSEVMSLSLQIEQPFDGAGAALSLGTAANPQELFAEAEVLPGTAATFEFSPRIEYPAGTVLVLTITPGAGATQGSGQLVISTVPTS